ncbi:MAG: RNA polymerase sigma factor [Candidatus Cryptobacteroides sp.]
MIITEAETFDNIIRAYYPKIMAYVSLLHSRQDAEDIAQDVFSLLWDKKNTLVFNDEHHLGAWLMTSAKSKSIDLFRKQARRAGQQSLSILEQTELDWFCESGPDLFEKIGRSDLYEKILALADELPPARKNVFRLSYVSNFSAKEISQMMDMPLRTVENHLYQALRFLRSKMEVVEFIIVFLLLSKF